MEISIANDEFLDVFSKLGPFNSVIDEVSNCLEKLVCSLYGYKHETIVNKVWVKMFQIKEIGDLALLPTCKDNLKLHIFRAIYVANMYLNTIRLHKCLDDPIYHGWKQDVTVQWRDDCFGNLDGKGDVCVSECEFTDDEISDTSDSER